MGSQLNKIESSLQAFGGTSSALQEYIDLRRRGFVPAIRRIAYENAQFSTLMRFVGENAFQEIECADIDFLLWTLCHNWTSGSGLRLPVEFDNDSAIAPLRAHDVPVTIEVRCGLMRVAMNDVRAWVQVDDGLNGKRSYAVQVTEAAATALQRVPSEPTLEVLLTLGSRRCTAIRGYVDFLIPKLREREDVIELQGGDALTGTRARISGVYNAHVRIESTLLGYSMALEPRLLNPEASATPPLAACERFLNDEVTQQQVIEFREWLGDLADVTDATAHIAKLFMEFATPDHPMSARAPHCFYRIACLSEHNTPIWMVVGSIRGLQTTGSIRIAPGITVSGPDDMPIRLVGGTSAEESLCRHWDPKASHLIAFFTAPNVTETEACAWAALSDAFDLLTLAISDSSWQHSDGLGKDIPLFVDGRLQDAVLGLDRWYHVHHVPSGSAHQYYAAKEKSSFALDLNEFAADSIRQRLDPLSWILRPHTGPPRKLTEHLNRAVSWFSRSRGSATLAERFLCLWIAIEFLLVKDEDSDSSKKDSVSGAVSRLLARHDRTVRRYWVGIAEDAYNARNRLVHEAEAIDAELTRLVPPLEHATFAVIWHCALTGQHFPNVAHPVDLLTEENLRAAANQ